MRRRDSLPRHDLIFGSAKIEEQRGSDTDVGEGGSNEVRARCPLEAYQAVVVPHARTLTMKPLGACSRLFSINL